MNRRNALTTLGATALGMSVLFGGAVSSYAQDATTPPATTQASAQDGRAAFEAERAQAYNDFVAALASELGDDKAAVDAAIRAALTKAVDDRLAAGDINAEQAAAAKAVIQVSDAPLMGGFGGPGGHGGLEGRGGGRGHGGPGYDDDHDEKGMPRAGDDQASGSLPSAPDAPAADDESAGAPVSIGGSVIS